MSDDDIVTTYITRYKIDGETVDNVDLIDFDAETGDVKRRGHGSANRVDYGTMLKDAPDEWEFIGVAEDYDTPATVWAVYESPDHTEWCAVTVTDDLAPPPGGFFDDTAEVADE